MKEITPNRSPTGSKDFVTRTGTGFNFVHKGGVIGSHFFWPSSSTSTHIPIKIRVFTKTEVIQMSLIPVVELRVWYTSSNKINARYFFHGS